MVTAQPLNVDRMIEQLVLHEQLRLKLYRDSKGIGTIGIGYNYQARGMGPINLVVGRPVAEDELVEGTLPASVWMQLCRNDALAIDAALLAQSPLIMGDVGSLYSRLSEVRKRVLVDVVYNIGLASFAGFANMQRWMGLAVDANQLAHPYPAEEAYWTCAGFELMNSHYAHDVGDGLGGRFDRADRLCQMLISGDDYTK